MILHSPICCHFGTLLGLAPSHHNDIRQACTSLVDSDVIQGGSRTLRLCIDQVMKECDFNILFIITSCIPELFNDDCLQTLAAIMADSTYANARKPTVIIEAPGFKGSEWQGTLQAMQQLVTLMKPKPVIPSTINLIGFFASDYKVDGDLKNIIQMLEGITINAIFPYDTYDRVLNIPAAQLNVVLRGLESIGDLLEQQFATPHIVVDYPYGLNQSRAFAESIYRALGLGIGTGIDRQEGEALQRLGNAKRYIEQLFMMPVAVVGYPPRLYGMANALQQELGMKIVAQIDRTEFAQEELLDVIKESMAVMFWGCDYEAGIADKLDIPFVAYDYPALRRVSIAENGYAGFQGYVNLLEDVINTLMAKRFSEVGNDR